MKIKQETRVPCSSSSSILGMPQGLNQHGEKKNRQPITGSRQAWREIGGCQQQRHRLGMVGRNVTQMVYMEGRNGMENVVPKFGGRPVTNERHGKSNVVSWGE